MKNFTSFGKQIKLYRENNQESLSQAGTVLGIDKTYLSKLENGHIQVSKGLLAKLVDHYSLSKTQAEDLFNNAGYGSEDVSMISEGEGVKRMENKIPSAVKSNENSAEVNVPVSIQVLYSDAIFVSLNRFGAVLDFAQRLGSTNKHNVVSRIGMSYEHLEEFIKVLEEQLKKAKLANSQVEHTKRVES